MNGIPEPAIDPYQAVVGPGLLHIHIAQRWDSGFGRQLCWLKTRMKQSAPQALIVVQ